MVRGCLGLCACLLAGVAAAFETSLPAGALLWEPDALSAAEVAQAKHSAEIAWLSLQRGEGVEVADSLQGEPSAWRREWIAQKLLGRLQASPGLKGVEAFLEWAEAQPVNVFVQHEETRAKAYLPLFDIARSARDVRRLWAEASQREAWGARWRADPAAALTQLAGVDAAAQAAAEALAQLDEAAFEASRAQIMAHARGGARRELPVALWLAVAERSPDPQALRVALRHGDPSQRLRSLTLLERLPTPTVETLLGQWEYDPEIGSAVTLALLPRLLEANAGDALRERLADPRRRDAAAAALARAAAVAATAPKLDALRASLRGEAELAGWRRFLLLLEDSRLRQRWALDGVQRP